MNCRVDRWSAVALRSSLVILTTVGALLLSSCGGSGQSSQSKRFKATRMIVFGDESSLLVRQTPSTDTNSLKYTNNGFTPGTTALDCQANQLWVQELAFQYSLEFAECNPLGVTTPTALMRATAGGKVADVVAAVDAFLASTPGNKAVPTDLITIMVGTNDILELYNSVTSSALTQAAALTEIKHRADLLAAQVDRLTNNDNTLGRVMYSTVPEVGLTPFGLSPSADPAFLNLLTNSFNNELRLKVLDNGRSRGFLNAAQYFRNIVDSVNSNSNNQPNGFVNVKVPVCQDPVNLFLCTPATLVSGATATDHLWAGNINFSEGAHLLLGTLAVDLATSLPW